MHLLVPLSIWNMVPPLQPQLPNPRDWEGKGGKPDSGILHKKIAGDPEPKREAGCPWSGSSPSPDFPLGWGGHDSLSPPLPSFLVCISPPGHVAAGAAFTAPYPAPGLRLGAFTLRHFLPAGASGPEPEPTDVVPGRDSIDCGSGPFPL